MVKAQTATKVRFAVVWAGAGVGFGLKYRLIVVCSVFFLFTAPTLREGNIHRLQEVSIDKSIFCLVVFC